MSTQQLWDKAVQRGIDRGWVDAYLGQTPSGPVDVPGRTGYLYVRLGIGGGLSVTQARNHPTLGAVSTADLRVRLRFEAGEYVVYGPVPLTTGGGGGGGTVPDPHDLNSSHHSGTLGNAQAPQFPLLAGGRTYTADLVLAPGVLVDGTDISVHVADPDAHHSHATAGAGITVSAGQVVAVNQAATFAWTGVHSFAQDIQLDADLDFVGAQKITTTTGNLTLAPAGDVVLDPVGDDVLLNSAVRLGTDNYASQLTGWRIDYNGAGDFRYIYTDELHAKSFIADLEQALAGGQIIAKSVAELGANFTCPAPSATATLTVKDLPSAPDMAVFQSGDIVRLRVFSRAGGSLTIADCWGAVTAYSNLANNLQSWTFTRSSAPNAGAVSAGTVIAVGALVLDYGVSGNGYYEVNAIDGLYAANSPYSQIVTWTGHPATGQTLQARLGNLVGVTDTALSPSGYGLYTSNGYFKGKAVFGPAAEIILDGPNGIRSQIDTTVDNSHTAYNFYRQDDSTEVGGLYAYRTSTTSESMYLLKKQKSVNSSIGIQSLANTGRNADITLFSHVTGEDLDSTLLIQNNDNAAGLISLRARRIALDPYAGVFGGVVGHVDCSSDFLPTVDKTQNLGSALLGWNTLYVDQIVATTTSGAAITGQTWTYPGDMNIDAKTASGDTTVTILNSGPGVANLSVGGDIIVGAGKLVDGVDISAFYGSYSSHILDPAAHHDPVTTGSGLNQTGQLLSVDSTVARNTWAVGAGAGLTGGGNLAASGITLNVGAGNGIAVAADTIAVDLAAVPGLEFGAGQLRIDVGLAGEGLIFNGSRQMAVGAGNGIAVAADSVAVALAASSGLEFGAGLLRLDANIAGDGLYFTGARVLMVGAGNGIAVAADSVALQLVTLSGMVLSGSGLAMGTPGQGSVSSTSAVTAASHTHSILTSSNPGATAAILASTGAGGLTLQTLAVQGNLDVQSGGDLTVAGSGAYAGTQLLFVDSSGGNVGILGAPDPQFALDVFGPIRGQYLVGPHALMVKNTLLLSHFDGKEPFNTNLTGEPNSVLGQVATIAGGVLYRPGKFGKAVEIARAATNLIANPQFDGNSTTGYTDYVTGAATGSRALLATREVYAGQYAYRLIKTGGAALDRWGTQTTIAVTSGQSYNVSVWVNVTAIAGGSLQIRLRTDTNVTAAAAILSVDSTVGATDGWVRLSVSTTATATGNANLYLWIYDCLTATVYCSGFQATNSPYAHPYVNGTRTAGSLYYTGIPVNWAHVTFMGWYFLADLASVAGSAFRLWNASVDASNFYELFISNADDKLRFATVSGTLFSSAVTIAANTWVHVALVVGGGSATIYVNGAASGSAAIPATPSGAPQVYVGTNSSLGTQVNGLVDDFAVVDRTVPASEIRSIYESNAPIFVETTRFSFRATPFGLVWADDEGLWMRNATGGSVLGVYGGVAASKSWGGILGGMAVNDLMIGDASRGGYLYWDDDAGGGVPSLYIGRSNVKRIELTGAGVLTINDSGGAAVITLDSGAGAFFSKPIVISNAAGMYAGSGSFTSPTTGIKIWSPGSNQGKLSGYNTGVEQITLDTDGKMYAGAGNVILDANGIRVKLGTSLSDVNAYAFVNSSGTVVGGYRGLVDANSNAVSLAVDALSAHHSQLNLYARSPSTKAAYVGLFTEENSVRMASVELGNPVTTGGFTVAISKQLTVSQNDSAGTIPPLAISQSAVAASMISFTGDTPGAGTGHNFSTDAIGTYGGKIRTLINGNLRWIPYYL